MVDADAADGQGESDDVAGPAPTQHEEGNLGRRKPVGAVDSADRITWTGFIEMAESVGSASMVGSQTQRRGSQNRRRGSQNRRRDLLAGSQNRRPRWGDRATQKCEFVADVEPASLN